jgi:hypothetical protein
LEKGWYGRSFKAGGKRSAWIADGGPHPEAFATKGGKEKAISIQRKQKHHVGSKQWAIPHQFWGPLPLLSQHNNTFISQ